MSGKFWKIAVMKFGSLRKYVSYKHISSAIKIEEFKENLTNICNTYAKTTVKWNTLDEIIPCAQCCDWSTFSPGWCHVPNNLFLMHGSSHIRSVLIGIKYQNCCGISDVYLLVVISMGQIQSKPVYKLVILIEFALHK